MAATLDDVVKKLEVTNSNTSNTTALIKRMLDKQTAMAGDQLEAMREMKASMMGGSNSPSGTGGTGSKLGDKSKGLGLGMAGLGAGVLAGAAKGIGGLALMGAALPAFFGGLLGGSAGLSWLQESAGLNYEGLKKAAIGFGDVLKVIPKEVFVTLGGILTVSAFTGTKGARGLGVMGFAISAFFGGLLAGDLVYTAVTALGGSLDFTATKAMVAGFVSIFEGMTAADLLPLGAILGGAAVLSAFTGGTSAAKGLGAMGLGITAFFGGLLLGEALYSGVLAAGGSLDFEATKKMLAGFSSVIGSLTKESVIALGVLFTGGMLVGYSSLKAKSLAKGLSAVLLGITAIMGALIVVEGGATLAQMAGVDFTAAASLFKGFSDSVGSLSEDAVIALGGLLVTGGIIGHVAKIGKAKIILGASALAASIGAFMGVFAGTGTAAAALGVDGTAIKNLMVNFGEAIDGLSYKSITVLGALVGAGGVLGAITFATGGIGAAIFAGIPALGASIAAFFVAFDAVALGGSVLGADGSNTKKLLTNFGDGIKSLTDIDFTNALNAGAGLKSLAGGIAAFFAVEAMGAVGSVFKGAKSAIIDGWNWITGSDVAKGGGGPIQMMIEAIKPLETIDQKLFDSMDKFGGALAKLAKSFGTLTGIDTKDATANLATMMIDVGKAMGIVDKLMEGGKYDTNRSGISTRRRYIDFGPGLENMDFEKLARMSNGISQLREALGIGHTESVSEAQLRTLVDERIAAQSGSTNVAVGDTTVDQSNNRGGDVYNLGAGGAQINIDPTYLPADF
jgi:hypothetical protein